MNVRRPLVRAIPLAAALAVAVVAGSACTAKVATVLASADGGGGDAGTACVWDQALADAAGLTIISAPPSMKVGDVFPSPFGCNGCGCTTNGFECTHNACRSEPVEARTCPSDTAQCADGAVLRRFGPACVFQSMACTTTGACTAEAYTCPDGSFRGRSGPFCTVPPCP